ncbi:hypothetical protein I3760_16G056700 [Carya illinoinensis]|nr:hypothetical protein I3760_16G056700 [Carya illinoinensis]
MRKIFWSCIVVISFDRCLSFSKQCLHEEHLVICHPRKSCGSRPLDDQPAIFDLLIFLENDRITTNLLFIYCSFYIYFFFNFLFYLLVKKVTIT